MAIPARSGTRGLSLALACALLACTGGESHDPASRRQVVVILLDAARADRFSCYGYARTTTPCIDALAADGALFLRHYTQGNATRRSLPVLLYSRWVTVPVFPFSPDVPLTRPDELFKCVDPEAVSLPALFRRDGFLTAGISAHPWLKPQTRFAAEFAEWHDLSATEPDPRRGYPAGAVIVDHAIRWVSEHRDRDYLLYLHLMDTHFPHFFEDDARALLGRDPPPLPRFERNGRVTDRTSPLSPDERAYLDALYDGGLRSADRELGRLFEALEGLGVVDHGVIAITADYGESLLEKPGIFEHGGNAFEPVARIPLILVGRRRVPAGRFDYLTGMIDLLPTLAGCMGIRFEADERPDGLDLSRFLDGTRPARDHVALDDGIVAGSFKALFPGLADRVLRAADDAALRELDGPLFDLSSDPEEIRDLRQERPELWDRLLSTWRTQVKPAYDRHDATARNSPPGGPFAIGAWSFETEVPVPRGPRSIDDLGKPVSEASGWRASDAWPGFYLACDGGAEPLRIEFAVPDGEYSIDSHMKGRCRVALPGASEPSLAEAEPFDPAHPTAADTVRIGIARVTDARFAAVIEGDAGGLFLLRSIGFTPEGTGASAEDDPLRDERLEALGYIDR